MFINWDDGKAIEESIDRDADKIGGGMRILLEKDGKVWDFGRVPVTPSNLLQKGFKHLLDFSLSKVIPSKTKKAKNTDAFVSNFIKDNNVKYLSKDKKPYATEKYLFKVISEDPDFELLPCECKFNYADMMKVVGLLSVVIPKGQLEELGVDDDDDADTRNALLVAAFLKLRKNADIQKTVALCLAIDKACNALKANKQQSSNSSKPQKKQKNATNTNQNNNGNTNQNNVESNVDSKTEQGGQGEGSN